MTAPALLVTVRGPTAAGDFAVTSDVATARLATALAVELGEAGPGPWCLALPGDGPLDPALSLTDLGVTDATELELRPTATVSGARS